MVFTKFPELQHDALIIDEQPDHLVLAVKISKQKIRENHALLACLSERAVTTSIVGSAIESVRKPKWQRAAVGILAVFCVVLASLLISETGETTPEPPLINRNVWIVNPVLERGDLLTIQFEAHRKRLCRTDVERTILDAKGVTVFSQRQSGIGQSITDAPISRQVAVKLPDGLKPGHYRYRSITYSDCGPKDQHAALSGDLAFELR